VVPPGVNGTTMRTGLVGQLCAHAPSALRAKAANKPRVKSVGMRIHIS